MIVDLRFRGFRGGLIKTSPDVITTNMSRSVVRSLLTVCCVVVVLSPGWCSTVAAPVTGSTEEPTKQAPGGCCELCHCKDREKPPPEPKQPAPPSRCCCYELDWLQPNQPVTVEADPLLVAFVTLLDNPSVVAVGYDLDQSIPVPAPPLHVLKCVWLC